MAVKTEEHEDLIKFIHLLDKWRKHYPTEEQILALTTVGSRRFPEEVRKSTKIARNLTIPSNFPFLDKIHSRAQTLAVAATIVFVFILLYSQWGGTWARALLGNFIFVFSILFFVILAGTIMYQHRIKTREYLINNEKRLKELKIIANELIAKLLPLAINGGFKPKHYPFHLIHDDYQGLRIVGRQSSSFQMMFSTPHALMISKTNAKIMSSMGRLSFYDGLRGFQGGKPAIKFVVSQIAGDLKGYLKRCADWRRAGVDIIVRKGEEGQIKRSYIIIDDQDILVSDQILEEIDIVETLEITKITEKSEKKRILDQFNHIWDKAQIAEELEAISWRAIYKEKAVYEREKNKA
ncbi:MAG: hypothetical protein ACW98F_06400 [Candidatus Hodarchaeales archaeon]|jgi:hypothetical protein